MGVRKRSDYDAHSARARKNPRWNAVRYLAKKRDGFRCTECGNPRRLEVHHVKRVKDYPELAYELDNLKTLCTSCHSRITKIECGFGCNPIPGKDAWKTLVDNMTNPNHQKERLCLNL